MELGLALYIVSKRGRQVIFGQTGLLFANRQWGLAGNNQANEQKISLPIAYSTTQFFATVTDYGMAGKAYGINVSATNSFIVYAPVTPFSVFYFSLGY